MDGFVVLTFIFISFRNKKRERKDVSVYLREDFLKAFFAFLEAFFLGDFLHLVALVLAWVVNFLDTDERAALACFKVTNFGDFLGDFLTERFLEAFLGDFLTDLMEAFLSNFLRDFFKEAFLEAFLAGERFLEDFLAAVLLIGDFLEAFLCFRVHDFAGDVIYWKVFF